MSRLTVHEDNRIKRLEGLDASAVETLAAAAELTGGPALTGNMLELRDLVEAHATDDDVVTIEIQDVPNEAGATVVLLQIVRMAPPMQAVIPMTAELVEQADIAEFASVCWAGVTEAFALYVASHPPTAEAPAEAPAAALDEAA